ncbi:PAS domain-containing sensor histidine kinase [Sphingobacterium suaedae]|uniref:histidine kinase n=1 Tax=Sphingobacterium suaedae TaxID=1686402 RepID=A0ABW5KF03_9SPHI
MENISVLNEKVRQLELENNRLKQEVAELSDFMENASIPLHWVDEKGMITWANQAELDALGYTKDEYIGSNIRDYHADQDAISDILKRLTNNETLLNYSADLKCKDGSIRHVLISSNVLRRAGKFVHTRCFTKDITSIVREKQEKNELLQRLEESETRLRLAVDSTRLGTWDWDTSTGYIYISPEGRRILGIKTEGNITAEHFMACLHAEDRTLLLQHMDTLLSTNNTERFDSTHRYHQIDTGDLRMIRVQGMLHHSGDTSRRFIGTILDVTDVVAAQENDARLAAIIRSSNDAIVAKTLDGIVTSWNAAAERIFGFREEEIVGRSILTIIPDDRKHEEDFILARLRGGESVEHFETKRLTKFGPLIDVSLTISPIRDGDGKIIGVSKIARDITEKKLEEQRKNDFVAMVSHEIKTPLTSVLLYTQILLKSISEETDSSMRNMLTKIEAYVKKLIFLVQDYLSITRIEEGKIELHRETFELCPLIDEIVEDARLLTSKHEILLMGCQDIMVYADRQKLGQVFLNLLSNAIKYSPSGGQIVIDCIKSSDKVTIAVHDQGIGISKNDQLHLFQRFFRASNDRSKHISGFGIGLYLVSEILRYHGSMIQVESSENRGSKFYFDLPTTHV